MEPRITNTNTKLLQKVFGPVKRHISSNVNPLQILKRPLFYGAGSMYNLVSDASEFRHEVDGQMLIQWNPVRVFSNLPITRIFLFPLALISVNSIFDFPNSFFFRTNFRFS